MNPDLRGRADGDGRAALSSSAALPLLQLASLDDLLPPRRDVDVDVLAARLGRIAFGVGFAVGPAILALAATALATTRGTRIEHVAPYLLSAWVGAVVLRVVVKALARRRLAGHGRGQGRGRADDKHLRASLIVPGIALAVFGPISLHAPFALLIGGNQGLDVWAAMSFGVVGFAQIVLAALIALRACRLVDGEPAMTPSRIFWWVVAASCVPGAIFFGVPPILTGLTGLVALPLLSAMSDVVDGERRRLAD